MLGACPYPSKFKNLNSPYGTGTSWLPLRGFCNGIVLPHLSHPIPLCFFLLGQHPLNIPKTRDHGGYTHSFCWHDLYFPLGYKQENFLLCASPTLFFILKRNTPGVSPLYPYITFYTYFWSYLLFSPCKSQDIFPPLPIERLGVPFFFFSPP